MSNVLILVEHSAGTVKKTALAGITFGQQVAARSGGAVHLLLIGNDAPAAAPDAGAYDVAKVYTVEGDAFADYNTEAWATAIEAAAKACDAKVIAAATSTTTKDVLPRVATRFDAAMAADVLEVIDDKTFKRPMWADGVVATVEITTDVKVATVRSTVFDAPASGSAAVESLAVDPDTGAFKAEFVSFKAIKSDRPDLATADRVVSGGRGTKGEFQVVEELADLLGAAVGATRAACDAGWVANDLQVGQTGKVVAPDLYIALGISGAIQHLAGMKSSKVIVAINKDEEAPIFQVADYGLVADLFKAVPELVELIKKG
jgi:electron transfer flavoprotein alpha subunit